MIKLVIADDEERVCRLINALGDWDALGIKVVGTAQNGVEALQLLGREKVDILITDTDTAQAIQDMDDAE